MINKFTINNRNIKPNINPYLSPVEEPNPYMKTTGTTTTPAKEINPYIKTVKTITQPAEEVNPYIKTPTTTTQKQPEDIMNPAGYKWMTTPVRADIQSLEDFNKLSYVGKQALIAARVGKDLTVSIPTIGAGLIQWPVQAHRQTISGDTGEFGIFNTGKSFNKELTQPGGIGYVPAMLYNMIFRPGVETINSLSTLKRAKALGGSFIQHPVIGPLGSAISLALPLMVAKGAMPKVPMYPEAAKAGFISPKVPWGTQGPGTPSLPETLVKKAFEKFKESPKALRFKEYVGLLPEQIEYYNLRHIYELQRAEMMAKAGRSELYDTLKSFTKAENESFILNLETAKPATPESATLLQKAGIVIPEPTVNVAKALDLWKQSSEQGLNYMMDVTGKTLYKGGAQGKLLTQSALERGRAEFKIPFIKEAKDFRVEVKKLGGISEESAKAYGLIKDNTNLISENLNKININETFNKKAIKIYGTTNNPESAGYITRNGAIIDSSGKTQGSGMEGRIIDHREIAQEALGKSSTASGTDAMIEFMNKTGDIRVVGAKDNLSIDIPISNGMPSDAQLLQIKQFIKSSGKDTIYYDLSGIDGKVLSGKEGTYQQMISDIKANTGINAGIKQLNDNLYGVKNRIRLAKEDLAQPDKRFVTLGNHLNDLLLEEKQLTEKINVLKNGIKTSAKPYEGIIPKDLIAKEKTAFENQPGIIKYIDEAKNPSVKFTFDKFKINDQVEQLKQARRLLIDDVKDRFGKIALSKETDRVAWNRLPTELKGKLPKDKYLRAEAIRKGTGLDEVNFPEGENYTHLKDPRLNQFANNIRQDWQGFLDKTNYKNIRNTAKELLGNNDELQKYYESTFTNKTDSEIVQELVGQDIIRQTQEAKAKGLALEKLDPNSIAGKYYKNEELLPTTRELSLEEIAKKFNITPDEVVSKLRKFSEMKKEFTDLAVEKMTKKFGYKVPIGTEPGQPRGSFIEEARWQPTVQAMEAKLGTKFTIEELKDLGFEEPSYYHHLFPREYQFRTRAYTGPTYSPGIWKERIGAEGYSREVLRSVSDYDRQLINFKALNEFKDTIFDKFGKRLNPENPMQALEIRKGNLVKYGKGKVLYETPDGMQIKIKADAVLPRTLVNEFNKMFLDTSKGEMFFRTYFDPITNTWKIPILALSPRWVFNNFFGNFILNTLGGVGVGGYLDAIGASVKAAKMMIEAKKAGSPITYVDALIKIGVPEKVVQGLYRGELSAVEQGLQISKLQKTAAVVKYIPDKVYRFNSTIESFFRTAHYFDKVGKDFSIEAATKSVNEFLFDYNALSPMQKAIFRRLDPFWNWHKNIIRLAVSYPVKYPQRFMLLSYANKLGTEAYDDKLRAAGVDPDNIPEYYKNMFLLPWKDEKGKDFYISMRGIDPLQDTMPKISYLHPIIQLILELAFKLNTFTGKSFTSPYTVYGKEEKVTPPIWRLILNKIPQPKIIEDMFRPYSTYDTGEPWLTKWGEPVYTKNRLLSVLAILGLKVTPRDIEKIYRSSIEEEQAKEKRKRSYEQSLESFKQKEKQRKFFQNYK